MKKWAFIVHPRDVFDLKVASSSLGRTILRLLSPKIAISIFNAPRVLCSVNGIAGDGILVTVPILPATMYQRPKYARQKILEAVNLGMKNGCQIVGLGELTAPFTDGGRWLLDKIPPDILITTGNSLTAGNSANDLLDISSGKDLIALIGATGSIGSAVAKILAQEGKNLLLVARNEKKLKLMAKECGCHYSTAIDDIRNADVIGVFTSSSELLISSDHLKHNAVVYDITQPSNVDEGTIGQEREDVAFVKGGLIFANGIRIGADLRLPEGKMFSCLAETIVLANNGLNFSSYELTGPVNPEIALFLSDRVKEGFPIFQEPLSEKAGMYF